MALGVSESNGRECSFVRLEIQFETILLSQLSPWLAVEIPDLIEKGIIEYKEKGDQWISHA